jgi:hypothetical protein
MFEDTDVPTTRQKLTTTAALVVLFGLIAGFTTRGVWCWLAH